MSVWTEQLLCLTYSRILKNNWDTGLPHTNWTPCIFIIKGRKPQIPLYQTLKTNFVLPAKLCKRKPPYPTLHFLNSYFSRTTILYIKIYSLIFSFSFPFSEPKRGKKSSMQFFPFKGEFFNQILSRTKMHFWINENVLQIIYHKLFLFGTI